MEEQSKEVCEERVTREKGRFVFMSLHLAFMVSFFEKILVLSIM